MQESIDSLNELIEGDEIIKRLSEELSAYRESELKRIQDAQTRASGLTKEIRGLTRERDSILRKAKIRRTKINKLQRRINTRRNKLVTREKRNAWAAYLEMFRNSKPKTKV